MTSRNFGIYDSCTNNDKYCRLSKFVATKHSLHGIIKYGPLRRYIWGRNMTVINAIIRNRQNKCGMGCRASNVYRHQ